ncbi:MAG TPA: penicillin-binding transpeptidase domain-containing protein [Tetragenococcus sp.]|nr:penicillin-binding transpeptidase domain-containing protein [Tetragenococcus sp.]
MRKKSRIRQHFKKKNLSTKNNRKKVGIILFATSIGLFFLFVARLSYVVVVGNVAGVSLETKTQNLYQGSQVVKAKRGTIYDRNGEAIAEDATSYSAYAILDENYVSGNKILYAQEKHFDELAEILADNVKAVNKKDVVKILKSNADKNKKAKKYGDKVYQIDLPDAKNISLQKKQNIEKAMKKADIAGIYFTEHPSRIYPNGIFSSHLIGYADSKTNKTTNQENLVGKMGIEEAYNNILKGRDGKIIYQKDNYQNPLPGTVAESEPAIDGQDVYTTLDARLQSYLENLMDQAWKKNKAEDLTAVLMDAKTGEILSMSQRPTFNPETRKGITDNWYNLFAEDTYEPGSTMKVMTVASAIDNGIFDPDETYTPGEIKLADATIRDWDYERGAKPSLTMRQALSWSSNVGMVTLEQRMSDRWQRYLKEFGFGRSTYSGIGGEKTGTLPEDNIVSQAMSSFGQAVGVTQLQMLQAFTAVSNDGTMVKPQFIKKIVNTKTSDAVVNQPEVVGHPVSAKAAQNVRKYMRDTVESEQFGTAYDQYKVPNAHVSAKTGTAQIAKDGNYLSGASDYLYSVVLMTPSEDPQYVMYLTLKRPEADSTDILSDIANPLLERAMNLSDVDVAKTAEEEQHEKVKVEDYRNLGTNKAANDAQKRGLTPIVIGKGSKVTAQSIKNGERVLAAEKLILLTDDKNPLMPDVTGWSKADIVKLGDLLKIDVSFEGDGYCTSQSIEPYQEISGNKMTFELAEND